MSNSDPIAREILEIVNSHDQLNIISQGQPLIYIWINNYTSEVIDSKISKDLVDFNIKVIRPQDMPLQVANDNFM